MGRANSIIIIQICMKQWNIGKEKEKWILARLIMMKASITNRKNSILKCLGVSFRKVPLVTRCICEKF